MALGEVLGEIVIQLLIGGTGAGVRYVGYRAFGRKKSFEKLLDQEFYNLVVGFATWAAMIFGLVWGFGAFV
ncbi:MAG: hypothetical protein KA214_06805 [Neisseriaceae bacterium]|nr:hypothetical protein [Neisseriaceae bacterium]